jgi:hypothetical protein
VVDTQETATSFGLQEVTGILEELLEMEMVTGEIWRYGLQTLQELTL